jgi:hypothetical protein
MGYFKVNIRQSYTYIPVVLFILALLCLLLPFIQIQDPTSGKTGWLDFFQVFPDNEKNWTGDEMGFDIPDEFLIISVGFVVILCGIFSGLLKIKPCLIIQSIGGFVCGLMILSYYNYLNDSNNVDGLYPVIQYTSMPEISSMLFLSGGLISLIILSIGKR